VAIRNSNVNVRDYGAKGDGTTDDSAAFVAAMASLMAQRTKDLANHGGHFRVAYKLYIPAGVYKITRAEALLPRTFTSGGSVYTFGLTIEGDGRFTTQIVYSPTTTGTYLMYNNDLLIATTIKDILFTCTAPANTEGFLYSFGHISQNMVFERCNWDGNWKYGVFLFGDNLNSEMSFFHCGVSGSWDTFFYIPPSTQSPRYVSGVAGSDQFVNYNFFACQFEVSRGNYINVQAGGSINIWGGSIMYTNASNTFPSTFFTLGIAINGGASRFVCTGVRFEIVANVNNKMMFCEWYYGSVKFIGCDNMSQQFVNGTDYVNTIFNFGSEAGPNVSFDGCLLMGKHEYRYNSGGYQRVQRATYRNCEMWHHENADTFLVMTNSANGANRGSHPLIRFEDCRGANKSTNQYKYLFDCTYGWHVNARAQSEKRILKIGSADNKFPRLNASEEVYLPMNSLITNITMVVAAGETTSVTAGWHYLVKTSEATPTTLADITPIGNKPSSGVNTSINLSPPFNANTDARRHLVVSAVAQVDADVRGFILIEYIA
jgi:hypothetical protein